MRDWTFLFVISIINDVSCITLCYGINPSLLIVEIIDRKCVDVLIYNIAVVCVVFSRKLEPESIDQSVYELFEMPFFSKTALFSDLVFKS